MGCVEGRESGGDAIGRALPVPPLDTPRTAPQDEAYSPRFVLFDEPGPAHLPQEVPVEEPISEPTVLRWGLLYISGMFRGRLIFVRTKSFRRPYVRKFSRKLRICKCALYMHVASGLRAQIAIPHVCMSQSHFVWGGE